MSCESSTQARGRFAPVLLLILGIRCLASGGALADTVPKEGPSILFVLIVVDVSGSSQRVSSPPRGVEGVTFKAEADARSTLERGGGTCGPSRGQSDLPRLPSRFFTAEAPIGGNPDASLGLPAVAADVRRDLDGGPQSGSGSFAELPRELDSGETPMQATRSSMAKALTAMPAGTRLGLLLASLRSHRLDDGQPVVTGEHVGMHSGQVPVGHPDLQGSGRDQVRGGHVPSPFQGSPGNLATISSRTTFSAASKSHVNPGRSKASMSPRKSWRPAFS